ncbi:MAG: hypothetical protein KKC80_08250 [Candidatus Margulisbacteria bacterium]|nr:hypothetical protein [Candidatus Margulisiibacteriota bacterium]MBU1617681.1 hypothetical protein [Candidatus Margulisiibacteriota bacterium]
MKNKFVSLALAFCLLFSLAAAAGAQNKIIRKTIKKVITPQITPLQAPTTSASAEVAPEIPPPPEPIAVIKKPEESKGLFGWGLNTAANAKLLYGSILLGLRGDIIFSDPLKLGEKIGLAEDAVEYRVGLGMAMSDRLKTIPLFADAIVYLKEGSLFGMDPYLGAGLIYNLYGTGRVSGGMGGQMYLGILADLGFESRAGISVGYATYKISDALSDSGIFVTLSQPIKL